MNAGRDVIITFFVRYFHNDYHYVEALIEFYFVSQVCGEQK